jgi:hypothetical protein
MRLGDLLIQAKLVTVEDVAQALVLQAEQGGRLGDRLVSMGAITKEALNSFIHRMPREPRDIEATRIDAISLLSLLMKLVYVEHLESIRQFVEAIKLPSNIVLELVQMAIDRKLLHTLGARDIANPTDMSYTLTDEGRRWVVDALKVSRYTGPAPVTLDEFSAQVSLQKLSNEIVTPESIRDAVGKLVFDERIIEQSGPALNSGRAILLYGPPGNGKTSVALCFANVFTDVIYLPYAVTVEGQIIRIFDPMVHHVLASVRSANRDDNLSFIRRDEYDARWIPCKRPFVVTGGELTLEMLDLRYDTTANFYEAPLHMKALGGCFVIDDFGRQLVSPKNLLNRWIVPLENRYDYLKLHTGKSFAIPFEELVVFSTNLEPEDLMDPAFLRRLPYKIEVKGPSLENYKRIFEQESARAGITCTDEIMNSVVHKVRMERHLDLAAYQPKFIVDQVVATCRFLGQPAHFEPRFIDYAADNLRVRRQSPVMPSLEATVTNLDELIEGRATGGRSTLRFTLNPGTPAT